MAGQCAVELIDPEALRRDLGEIFVIATFEPGDKVEVCHVPC